MHRRFVWEFSSSFNLQLFTKNLRVTLVFMWNNALRGKFNFYFTKSFLLVLTKFSFSQEDWALGYYSLNFLEFPDISWFPEILSYKLFGNSWENSFMPCLLLIITFLFIHGEMKIWQNIKKSQNIMKMIIALWSVCISYLLLFWGSCSLIQGNE